AVLPSAGRGRVLEYYRGVRYVNPLQPESCVQIVVPDSEVDELVRVIDQVARRGTDADGRIWVVPVIHLVRIGASDVGEGAPRCRDLSAARAERCRDGLPSR